MEVATLCGEIVRRCLYLLQFNFISNPRVRVGEASDVTEPLQLTRLGKVTMFSTEKNTRYESFSTLERFLRNRQRKSINVT